MNKIELLRKIKSLAEGVGNTNEKRNALRKLELLMTKYGVTEADLSDEQIEERRFEYTAKFEQTLILHIACKLGILKCQDGTINYRRIKGKRKLLLQCTKAQEMELKYLTEIYLKAYQHEEKKLQTAFITKHNLTGEGSGQVTLTRKELAKMKRLMAGIDDITIHKQIEQKRKK